MCSISSESAELELWIKTFVARKCRGGTVFIIHGQTWKIINVNEEKLSIEVEPTTPTLDAQFPAGRER